MNKTLKEIRKELKVLLKAEQRDSSFGSDLANHSYEQGMKDAISLVEDYLIEFASYHGDRDGAGLDTYSTANPSLVDDLMR